MDDILEQLNEKQRQAVFETEGYVRVIAGAGSGKTRLLVSRYAYLVQEYGIDSANILCVTFTNKAAGEMKRRIRALIGEENDTTLICTYHGFCNRLLRENPEKLFLNRQFQIMDEYQQKAVLGEIYQKFELKLDYASFESMLRSIGAVKSKTDYVPRICDPKPCQILETIENQKDQIVEEFLQRQKATYSLDFHDLISFAIYVLEHHEDVREKWQSRLNYIMVDEFQDSTSVEMRLIELLSGKYRNLMIVGDPDQNIYEWRGADVKLLVDFDKLYGATKTIILNQNYRSTPEILKCANTLIDKNTLRLKKDLFTRKPAGASVMHYHSKTDFEEMDQVVCNIKRLRAQKGLKFSDFAILYRSGFLSRVAEKKLAEKNIPYEIFGGVKFYQRMEILDLLAYLKLIAFDDDASFRRIVNKPRRRFGRVKMGLLEDLRARGRVRMGKGGGPGDRIVQMGLFDGAAGESAGGESAGSGSLFAALKDNLGEQEFSDSDAAGFVRLIVEMRQRYSEMRISDIVNEVAEKSGYESYIRELGDEERLDNLAEFKRIANEFEREFGENLTLEAFLQQIALQSNEDAGDAKDTVKLMTIHSSKGLEFPAVFILGFTEGVFPSAKTIETRKGEGLEEERRLCYVAITRAEKYLFLMDNEGTSPNGMKNLCSRFLDEIGENNYTRIGQISEELRRESRDYTAKLNSQLQMSGSEHTARSVGDSVEHHIFGKGVIRGIDGKRQSYLVKFDTMPQPRNISRAYFEREHEDARKKVYGGENRPEPARAPEIPVLREASGRGDAGNGGPQAEAARGANVETEGHQGESSPADAPEDEAFRAGDPETAEDEAFRAGNPETEEDEAFRAGDPETEKDGAFRAENPETEEDNVAWPGDPDFTGEDSDDSVLVWDERFLPLEQLIDRDELESCEQEDMSEDAPQAVEESWAEDVKKHREDSRNLWKDETVPHAGWVCGGVEDLGAPVGICEMCGHQIIRYAHHMEHPEYRSLICGCVCAGRMEGDVAEAKRREAEFKNRQARRASFFKRQWKQSRKGNEYLKIDGHVVVLFRLRGEMRSWRYSIDNDCCGVSYPARERALAAAFNALEKMRGQKEAPGLWPSQGGV